MKTKIRINLLSDAEIDESCNIRVFNDQDREVFFVI